MKQSAAPLIITVERGVFISARNQERQLVQGQDYLTIDLDALFECAKCSLWWPMDKAVIVEDKPICPVCAGKWTHPAR